MKVLITAGGTEEPIDGVRCLSNRSTGSTGRAIAAYFAAHGADVVFLHADGVACDDLPVTSRAFRTFDDLAALLQSQLGRAQFDAVIHLAAVGDYRLESIEVDGKALPGRAVGKIGSGHELLLRMTPNPKLIDSLRPWSLNPGLKVVGFKLTNSRDPKARQCAVHSLLERGIADLVVHNDLVEIRQDRHPAVIHSAKGVIAETFNKNEMASTLFTLLAAGDPA